MAIWKQIRVEVRPRLIVVSGAQIELEAAERLRVGHFVVVRLDAPGVREVSILTAQRCAPGEVVHRAYCGGVAGAGVGIEFRLIAEAVA